MTKLIERNVAEILVLLLFIVIMSSCQTVKEIRMGERGKMTQCNYVNR